METIKTFIEGIKAKDIADIFICIGVVLLLIDYIRGEKNETRGNKK